MIIYHVSDIHFGVENYGRIDSKTGIHSRLLDFKNSLSVCVDNAINENVDLVVFTGDAYKTAYPTPTQQRLLMEEFFKLYKANIPMAIIIGNHDHPLSYGKSNSLDIFAQLPLDGFYVFSSPELKVIETKSGLIQVVGIPWPTRNNVITSEENRLKKGEEVTRYISEKVGEIINSLAKTVDTSKPAILAGHLTVSTGIFSGSEKRSIFGTDPTFLPSQLALPEFDYVALGHLHRHQNLNPKGLPPVVYAGSIDRIDFGERKEAKGYCRVSLGTDTEYEFIKIDTRPFIQIEVKLKPDQDQTQQILNAINKNVKDAIIKIIYHVPDGKQDKVDLAAIQYACKDASYLASITPIRTVIKTARKVDLKIDMKLEDIVKRYLDMKYQDGIRERLLKKAKLLISDIENENGETL